MEIWGISLDIFCVAVLAFVYIGGPESGVSPILTDPEPARGSPLFTVSEK